MNKTIITTLLGFTLIFPTLYAQQTVGLTAYDSTLAEGYTLFSPFASRKTYLINNCGHMVNLWSSDYTPGANCYLNNNGDLIRAGAVHSYFSSAGGFGGMLERTDWSGELKWQYLMSNDTMSQHHDFKVMPNGNILVLVWEKITRERALENGRDPAMIIDSFIWSEAILEIKPKGTDDAEIVWEWHAMDHLVQDKYSDKKNYGKIEDHPELIDFNSPLISNFHDWLHFNSVDYNSTLNQIVVSCHAFSEIYIIDHSTSTSESSGHFGGVMKRGGDILYRWGNPMAYKRGTALDRTCFKQHDAQWIPAGYKDAGKILFFNNGTERRYSSVEIIKTTYNATTYSYTLEADKPYLPMLSEWIYQAENTADFFSTNMGGVQRLNSGNTLICESTQGRLFEINEDQEIVWEYINPVVATGPISQGKRANGNNIFRGIRYPTNHRAFSDKTITDQGPIELNHLYIFCDDTTTRQDTTTTSVPGMALEPATVFPNPTNSKCQIAFRSVGHYHWAVSTTTGQIALKGFVEGQSTVLDVVQLAPGIYTLSWQDGLTGASGNTKLIKN